MVQANLGVSIVPDLAVKPFETARVKSLPLGPDAPKRTLGLAYHKDFGTQHVISEVFAALAGVIAGSAPLQDRT